MKRKWIYFSAIILGLILLFPHHLGGSLGDDLFRWIGISPWTKEGKYGLHLPALLGSLLLLFGCIRVWKIYRSRYSGIGILILICWIAFVNAAPHLSEQFFFLTKHNSTGISSVAYSKKDSRCTYAAEDRQVKAQCTLNIYNYGKLREITLRPIVNQEGLQADLEPKVVIVPPRSQVFVNEEFFGEQLRENSIEVWDSDVSVEVEVNGYKRTFE